MIFIGLYILLTAISFIFIHSVGSTLPAMLIVFLSLSNAILFFHLINYKEMPKVYQNLIDKKGLFIYFSILVFLMWIGSFLIPIHYSAGLLILTFMNTSSSLGAIHLFFQEKSFGKALKLILLVANLVFFYIYSAKYYAHLTYPIMIVSTVLTGASGFYSTKASAVFIKHKFSASQILAIRFWLLWLFSLIYVCATHELSYLTWKAILQTSGISILSLIAPLYFFQKSIEDIGPEKASLFCAMTPVVTYLLERCVGQDNFGYLGYFSLSLAAIIIGYYAIMHSKNLLTSYKS